jgi:hypothetical protein
VIRFQLLLQVRGELRIIDSLYFKSLFSLFKRIQLLVIYSSTSTGLKRDFNTGLKFSTLFESDFLDQSE